VTACEGLVQFGKAGVSKALNAVREPCAGKARTHGSSGAAFPRGNAATVLKQDHRAIKRRTRPMLGFKDFNCARVILSGIELMHMIKKRQVKCSGRNSLSAAQQFYSLVS